MKIAWLAWGVVLVAAVAAGCASHRDAAATRQLAEKMVSESYSAPSPDLLKRLVQDKSQQVCSKIGDTGLTQAEAAEVVELARASMKYPDSGKLMGDWKIGEALA